MTDVFVSYSRRDLAFVRELHGFLAADGRDVWVDWEDIPAASRWEQDIEENIDAAESVVFVVSGNSLGSEYCGLELRHAQQRGKRIVPLALDGADPAAAPPALRELNWIWCRNGDDRSALFRQVAEALDTDLDWARAHTRLLVRAVEWDARRSSSLLLRGRALDEAIEQLAQNGGKEPRPTELQQEYVRASRHGARRRQRRVLGSVSFALLVAVGLAVVAVLQRNTANDRARVARSQALAAEAEQALATTPATALRDAVQAMETSRTDEARLALRHALVATPVSFVVPAPPGRPTGTTRPDALAFARGGLVLVGLTPDRTLHAWRSDTGRALWARPADRAAVSASGRRVVSARGELVRVDALDGHRRHLVRRLRPGEHAAGVGFAGESARVLAVLPQHGARVVDVATGRSVPLARARLRVSKAIWSGDGGTVVTIGNEDLEDPVRVWDARTGRLRRTLPFAYDVAVDRHGAHVAALDYGEARLWEVDGRRRPVELGFDSVTLAFSPAGGAVAAVASNGSATVWRTANGRRLATFPGFGSLEGPATIGIVVRSDRFFPGVAFSPDGRLLAVAAADGNVRVVERASGNVVASLAAGWANSLAFAPDGGALAAMTWDGAVVAARAPAGIPLGSGAASSCEVPPLASPDGAHVLSPSPRGGATLSDFAGREESVLRPPVGGGGFPYVAAAAFSGDGRTVAVASAPSAPT